MTKSKKVFSPEKVKEKTRKQVLEKLANGKVSCAANIIDSFGVADLDNEQTKEALRKKLPDRLRELPESVPLS